MKRHSIRLLAVAALLSLTHSVYAQAPDTLWTQTFGGMLGDNANAVIETSDGGFVIGGQTFSFSGGASDAYLVRTDENGDTLWTRTYGEGGGSHENAHDIEETSDGGFIMTGSVSSGSSDMLLIRTDADGETVWMKTYGWFDTDRGYDVLETPDGGFIVCGSTRSYHNGFGSSVWLFRTDVDGDSLWSKTYGGSSYQDGFSIDGTSDDGFIITGSYNNGGSQSADVWLLRADADGDTLWTKTFGGEGTDEGTTVLETSDGGYALTASSYNAGPEVSLMRFDANGDSLWTKKFGESIGRTNTLDETSDGGFVLTGTTVDGAVWLVRTDADGSTLWTETYGGDEGDQGVAVRQTADGGYVVVGTTESYGAGAADIWLIRLDAEGTTSAAETPIEAPGDFLLNQNYPNPFNPSTTISYAVRNPANVNLTIFNMLGQAVRTLVDSTQPPGEYSVTWDGGDGAGGVVSSGPYLYRMKVGDVVQTRSMLLLK